MAFNLNQFIAAKTAKNTTGFSVDKFLEQKGFAKKDLTTSEGLYQTALDQGGLVGDAATEIMRPETQSFWGKVRAGSKKALMTTLDVLQRPNFAIASAIKAELDQDPATSFVGGLKSGITGRTKHTFSDVFEEAGWNPETKGEKITKNIAGFALDVLLDPTTYLTFGAGAGAKVGTKVLSKAGQKFVAKAAAKKLGTQFGEQFIKEAVVSMAEKSPQLYGKFIDQGGIKFFGNTLVSSGRIAGAVKMLPGATKLLDLSEPARNSLYALFNRDASAKFGKLPQEFIDIKQKYIDLGATKSADAVENAIQIAQANKITQREAELITNAIESKTHLADDRLENARKLFEQTLGRDLREELKRGIKVGELPNYVPHILVESEVKNIPFKPEGARVSLKAARERTIQKFFSESGEEVIGTADKLGLSPVKNVQGMAHALDFGEFKSIKDIEDTLKDFGYKLTFKPQSTVRRKYGGYFNPTKKEIVVASAQPSLDDVMSIVKHELTHNAHFQLAGDIQMLENFTGRGVSKKLNTMLEGAKTSAKEEMEQIFKSRKLDSSTFSSADKAYYRKPTELLARAMQTMLENPAQAEKLFPKTTAALKTLQDTHPLFKLLKKEVTKSGDLIGNRMFEDAAGKLFSTKSADQATIAEINDAFGKEFFDPNIVNAVATRATASARATTTADFLREVAQKFGAKADNAPSNFVKTGTKELEGLVFHPAIAEQIDNFKKALINDESTNNLLRAFDKVQNLWKASVTSIFPAFHGRNAISNVFLNFLDIGLDALNPAKHLLAGEMLNLNRQANNLEKATKATGKSAATAASDLKALLKKPVLTANDGKKWTFGELRKVIKDNRVAFGSDYTGFLDIRETISEKLSRAGTIGSKTKRAAQAVNPLSQENLLFRGGRSIGRTVEEQARLVNFLTNLGKTGDVTQAANRTKQFLFDYTNLSAFEKTFMRRIVPFYTFMRKNLELQATQLVKQPGKFATQAKMFTTISKVFSGGALTEDEKEKLPAWLQSGLGLVTRRDGNKIEIISQLGTPIEAVFQNLQPNALLGSLSPVVAVPLQVAVGKHFFFDRDLKDVDDAKAFKNAPQFIKDYIGFTVRKNKDGSERYIALNPTRLFIVQNIPPSSRVVSVLGQLEEENVSGKLKALRQLTGLKPYGKDLDQEELYREKEKIRALQDLLDKSGVAPIFQRSFIPKEQSEFLPEKYK